MYELEYVKKRKRRKRAAIIGGISVVVVSTLSIVAFLGRFVGTFTVSLDTGNVKLALSQKSDFANSTSFLRVDELPIFNECTYSYLTDVIGSSQIDNEETNLKVGATSLNDDGSIRSLLFFKYTFYVKNVGNSPARYTFSLNILDSKEGNDGRKLDDTLRVMLYENSDLSKHESKVYAKKSNKKTHEDEEGNPRYEAPIAGDIGTPEFVGWSEPFKNSSVVTSFTVNHFAIGDIRRYTIATWLEGEASDSGRDAPTGANIKLGVEINAYEI